MIQQAMRTMGAMAQGRGMVAVNVMRAGSLEKAFLHLLFYQLFMVPFFPHFQWLTAAEYRDDALGKRFIHLPGKKLPIFPKILSPLAVPQDHIWDSQRFQHQG